MEGKLEKEFEEKEKTKVEKEKIEIEKEKIEKEIEQDNSPWLKENGS